MDKLKEIIKARIGSKGPMRFRDFMQSALYEPELGYYTRPGLDIGKGGDFYTSPHSHAVFGRTLGRQVELCFDALGGTDVFRDEPFHIVECGGGRGWLASDIMDYLKGREIYNSISYTLLELNPSMARRQQGLLGSHADRVRWANSLDEIQNIKGMVISNELMDAFAVHLIEFSRQWDEIFIDLDGDTFVERPAPVQDGRVLDYIARYIGQMPQGCRTEVNLHAPEWLTRAANALMAGYILTIDYGYPARELHAPERNRGTILCYKGHVANEDFLEHVGQQDITAHVNFTDLKNTGDAIGLDSIGYARQGVYLVSLGIDRTIAEYYGEGNSPGMDMHKINNLIMPGTMGDTHKVLLQSKKADSRLVLKGFKMKNEIDRLGH